MGTTLLAASRWSESDLAQVRILAGRGLSAAKIADKMGRTRNSIIGICLRRGISLNGQVAAENKARAIRKEKEMTSPPKMPKPHKPARLAKLASRSLWADPEPKRAPPVDAETYDREAPGVTLMEMTGRQCKWPLGDPREEGFKYCGHRRDWEQPYCTHHRLRAKAPYIARRLRIPT